MSAQGQQSYAAHRRWVPMYHFVTAVLLLLNLGYAIWMLIKGFGFGNIVQVTTAFALIVMLLYLRIFPLAVQDRLIRLEERLRMARVLPEDMKSKIDSFTVGQLLGLRFASDAELPALAKRVAEKGVTDREEIKKLITDWRPDEVRA